MSRKIIGKNCERWDAFSKVTGKADYTGDIATKKKLYGKIFRSTIAHGKVTFLDVSEAEKMPGVVKVMTPDDVPSIKFPTAGHPHSLNPKTADIADRNILTKDIRLYGDEIAVVIAETELQAEAALEKIIVEYEEYPFYLTPEESLAEGAKEIHEGTKNIIAATEFVVGNVEDGFGESDYIIEDEYSTQTVQHCHMENQIAYAYQDVDKRWVCVSSTQIPHICRRILGQAFGMPWGQFRVIKPLIGGGFGNKQDVTIEPLVVAMSMAVGGALVMLDLQREETLAWTRVRHAISYKMKMGLTKDGILKAIQVHLLSNNGAYASHGHSIAAKGGGMILALYNIPHFVYNAKTVYTNTAAAGAMRGYGVPQVVFAIESFMDKIAKQYNFDPIEFRLKNLVLKDKENPINHIIPYSAKIEECIIQGKEHFKWEEKRKLAEEFNKVNKKKRRGVGLAAFPYTSGTYPKGYEIGGCRLILNQDGSIKMMVGATEIGQGSDTVFRQMVAETVGVSYEYVIADEKTDTDYAPFDTGAYASRQSYVSGKAVRAAAEKMRAAILAKIPLFYGVDTENVDIVDNQIIYKDTNEIIAPLSDLAIKTYYDLEYGQCIVAEASINCKENSYPYGVTFAEVEINLGTGETEILSILNVHDSGKILNPLLATGQVQGGLLMGIAYGLREELKYDKKYGYPLNNNLLDYKMPTAMDMPNMDVLFIESDDEFGPYGNKALGEPPICSPAAALRNAICHATGFDFNHLPVTPQKIVERLLREETQEAK